MIYAVIDGVYPDWIVAVFGNMEDATTHVETYRAEFPDAYVLAFPVLEGAQPKFVMIQQ